VSFQGTINSNEEQIISGTAGKPAERRMPVFEYSKEKPSGRFWQEAAR